MQDSNKGSSHPKEATAVKSDAGLVRIPFHGDDILAVDVDGQPHIVLKPAIDAIGLEYWSQVEKLKSRSWARTGLCPVRQSDGRTRDVVIVDVRTFLMLLATVDERRVAKDVAPKLIAYQAEVADAIESYWTKGGAINPRATDEQIAVIIDRAKRQAEVLRVLDGIVDPTWLESKARHLAARALGEEPEDDPAKRLLTVGEYLEGHGMKAGPARKLSPQFGKRLKALYVQRHGVQPGKSRRFVDGAQRDVAVYTEADRDLFDAAWVELVEDAVA